MGRPLRRALGTEAASTSHRPPTRRARSRPSRASCRARTAETPIIRAASASSTSMDTTIPATKEECPWSDYLASGPAPHDARAMGAGRRTRHCSTSSRHPVIARPGRHRRRSTAGFARVAADVSGRPSPPGAGGVLRQSQPRRRGLGGARHEVGGAHADPHPALRQVPVSQQPAGRRSSYATSQPEGDRRNATLPPRHQARAVLRCMCGTGRGRLLGGPGPTDRTHRSDARDVQHVRSPNELDRGHAAAGGVGVTAA